MRILKLTSRGRRSVSAERAESKPQEEEEERSCGARCEPAGRAVAFFAVLVRDPPGLDVFPTHEDRVLLIEATVDVPVVALVPTHGEHPRPPVGGGIDVEVSPVRALPSVQCAEEDLHGGLALPALRLSQDLLEGVPYEDVSIRVITHRVGLLAEGRFPRVHEARRALRKPRVDFLLRLLRVRWLRVTVRAPRLLVERMRVLVGVGVGVVGAVVGAEHHRLALDAIPVDPVRLAGIESFEWQRLPACPPYPLNQKCTPQQQVPSPPPCEPPPGSGRCAALFTRPELSRGNSRRRTARE
mmetsp:Transcript_51288/g.121553  ORF Transcript_51288/g.121553 Transcript_51288/m.121553 type:complete len:298 (+) Transcript_51288:163-1056(+)